MVRGLDGDAAAAEVFHGVGAEFGVEHAEDFGGDVVDCYLEWENWLALVVSLVGFSGCEAYFCVAY